MANAASKAYTDADELLKFANSNLDNMDEVSAELKKWRDG